MKKRELLHISQEAAGLIRRYCQIEKEDDSLYLNPDGKRTRLLASAEELVKSIARVNEGSPSFDEISRIASDLLVQARTPEGTPVHKETKRQAFNSLVEQLKPLLNSELVGKCLCLKTGAYDFDILRVTEVEVSVGIYDRLEIIMRGAGIFYTSNPQKSERSAFTDFGMISFPCADLLIDGRDRNDYKDRWLYVLSEEEMAEEFIKRMADLARLIGIDLKGTL
jgi:hypothetical protein